ncbi:MAG: hypothetical protein KKA73_18995 [Chloroflexi bacterium]|nr:hypothetical protein [Chloroflexota bacterium]MBU1749777.1 hypothetical protein [Chloroflexota bacterium]
MIGAIQAIPQKQRDQVIDLAASVALTGSTVMILDAIRGQVGGMSVLFYFTDLDFLACQSTAYGGLRWIQHYPGDVIIPLPHHSCPISGPITIDMAA